MEKSISCRKFQGGTCSKFLSQISEKAEKKGKKNGTGGGTWTHTYKVHQILSLARLPYRHSGTYPDKKNGSGSRTRTGDLRIMIPTL